MQTFNLLCSKMNTYCAVCLALFQVNILCILFNNWLCSKMKTWCLYIDSYRIVCLALCQSEYLVHFGCLENEFFFLDEQIVYFLALVQVDYMLQLF